MITKEQILKNFKRASNKVFVPEFDCYVNVQLPPADVFISLAVLLEPFSNEKGDIDTVKLTPQAKVELIKACRPVLEACVVDDQGNLIFDGPEGKKLYDALSVNSVMSLISGIPGDDVKKKRPKPKSS